MRLDCICRGGQTKYKITHGGNWGRLKRRDGNARLVPCERWTEAWGIMKGGEGRFLISVSSLRHDHAPDHLSLFFLTLFFIYLFVVVTAYIGLFVEATDSYNGRITGL
jgi:hypothetical protein